MRVVPPARCRDQYRPAANIEDIDNTDRLHAA
jgi:hypothetical protein